MFKVCIHTSQDREICSVFQGCKKINKNVLSNLVSRILVKMYGAWRIVFCACLRLRKETRERIMFSCDPDFFLVSENLSVYF